MKKRYFRKKGLALLLSAAILGGINPTGEMPLKVQAAETSIVETGQEPLDEQTAWQDVSEEDRIDGSESETGENGTDMPETDMDETDGSVADADGMDKPGTDASGEEDSAADLDETGTLDTDAAETDEADADDLETDVDNPDSAGEETDTGETGGLETDTESLDNLDADTAEEEDRIGENLDWEQERAAALQAAEETRQATVRAMNLNVNGSIAGIINPGLVDDATDAWGNGKGSYIYFGNYYQSDGLTKEPILWRVLDCANQSSISGSADSILLWSDKILDRMLYEEESHVDTVDIWQDSLMKKWLNSENYTTNYPTYGYTEGGFLNTAFSEAERGLIRQTYKSEDATNYVTGYYSLALRGEKIFLLSLAELENVKYGFYMSGANIVINNRMLTPTPYAQKKGISGNFPYYWLRTSTWLSSTFAGYVGAYITGNSGGMSFKTLSSTDCGVVPAFNLDRSQILYSSVIDLNKQSEDDLTLIPESSENRWKLTIKDSAQVFQKNGKPTRSGTVITVPYSYTYSGTGETKANQVSIMITDRDFAEEGVQVLYYGKGKVDGELEKAGSVRFELPEDYDYNSDSWKIYVFSERVNGWGETDFASVPVEITESDLELVKIDNMEIMVEAPASGKILAANAVCMTQGITEAMPKIKWKPGDGKAGYNKQYAAEVKLIASPEYKFTASTTATVNGQQAEVEYNPVDKSMTVRYSFPATEKAKLLNIPVPPAVKNVKNGAAKSAPALGLPNMITIETEDTEVSKARVTWDMSGLTDEVYNPAIKEEQTFQICGIVTLPEGIVNPEGISLEVKIEVTVSAQVNFFIEISDAQEKNPASPEAVGYATVKLKKTSMVYTGAELRPGVTVKYTYLAYDDSGSGLRSARKQKTLKENVDYALTYTNNIDVGNSGSNHAPTVTITGIGDFAGTIDKTFTITQKSIKNITMDPIGDVLYTGEDLSEQIKDALVVRSGIYILNPASDYTVTFSDGNNSNMKSVVGSATADTKITLTIMASTTGNYSGVAKKKATLYIRANGEGRTNLADCPGLEVRFKKDLSEKPLTYNGKQQKPAVVVKLNGKTLSTKNYSLIYRNNIDAGVNTATVTVLGKNKCYGRKELSFSIRPKDFSKVSVKGLSQLSWRKSINDLKPRVQDGSRILVQDKDYTMDDKIEDVQFLGKTYTKMTITFKPTQQNSNYISGTAKTVKLTVVKRSLTNRLNVGITVKEAKITQEQLLNGTGVQPEVIVKYNEEILQEGTDYTLSYKNNKKLGTGKVVITGKGNYSGKRTIKFKITLKTD